MAKFKSKSGNTLSGGCLSLFGMPFLCAGLFLAGFYFYGYSSWWRALGWQEVPCWIESANLKESHGDDSNTYQATATYRYEFKGREYHGDRVAFGSGSDNIGSFQRNAHRELSKYVVQPARHAEAVGGNVAKPFRCYVNPNKPEEAVLYRNFRWEMQAFFAIFALTFPAVGAGLVVGGIVTMRHAKKQLEILRLYPDEPWKSKPIWSGNSIPESSTGFFKAVVIYMIWSGAVIFPLIAITGMSGAFDTDPKSYLVLIFLALWCLVAWIASKGLRQKWMLGSSRFEMAQVPAWPGGVLEGSILLEKPLPVHGTAEVSLVCDKVTTVSTNDGSSTHTETLWSDTAMVPLDLVIRDLAGFRMPVKFSLPADAPESGDGDRPAVNHFWKLRLNLPTSGIKSEFEVPVFRTAQSPAIPPKATPSASSIREMADKNLPESLAEQRIQVEFDSHGLPLSIHSPAARGLSMIGFLIVFNLIWTGATVFLFYQHAPFIFRFVWSVSSSVIWCIVIYQLLHSRKISFNDAGLEVTNRYGPWAKTETTPKSEIVGFSHDTNMSSNNVPYYRVRVENVFGKKKTLVSGIKGSGIADALAHRCDEWRRSVR